MEITMSTEFDFSKFVDSIEKEEEKKKKLQREDKMTDNRRRVILDSERPDSAKVWRDRDA